MGLIPPPAADAVTFTVTRRRLATTMALVGLITWVVFRTLNFVLVAALGDPPSLGGILRALAGAVLFAAFYTGLLMLLSLRGLPWVRSSSAGLEFAGTGRDPVFVPWAAIAAVRLRLPGPFAVLEVTPAHMAAARIAPIGRRRPWVRRFGRKAFKVDVGLLRPEKAALMAEITARLAARV